MTTTDPAPLRTPKARLPAPTTRGDGAGVVDAGRQLAAARENNRFADRRIADLEASIAKPRLGQGNEVGRHSAKVKP